MPKASTFSIELAKANLMKGSTGRVTKWTRHSGGPVLPFTAIPSSDRVVDNNGSTVIRKAFSANNMTTTVSGMEIHPDSLPIFLASLGGLPTSAAEGTAYRHTLSSFADPCAVVLHDSYSTAATSTIVAEECYCSQLSINLGNLNTPVDFNASYSFSKLTTAVTNPTITQDDYDEMIYISNASARLTEMSFTPDGGSARDMLQDFTGGTVTIARGVNNRGAVLSTHPKAAAPDPANYATVTVDWTGQVDSVLAPTLTWQWYFWGSSSALPADPDIGINGTFVLKLLGATTDTDATKKFTFYLTGTGIAEGSISPDGMITGKFSLNNPSVYVINDTASYALPT